MIKFFPQDALGLLALVTNLELFKDNRRMLLFELIERLGDSFVRGLVDCKNAHGSKSGCRATLVYRGQPRDGNKIESNSSDWRLLAAARSSESPLRNHWQDLLSNSALQCTMNFGALPFLFVQSPRVKRQPDFRALQILRS